MYLIKEPEVAQFFICTVRGGFSQTRQPDEFRRDECRRGSGWMAAAVTNVAVLVNTLLCPELPHFIGNPYI